MEIENYCTYCLIFLPVTTKKCPSCNCSSVKPVIHDEENGNRFGYREIKTIMTIALVEKKIAELKRTSKLFRE